MTAKMGRKSGDDDGRSYGELRRELDEIMDRLQDDTIDVDEAAGLYEQALELINRLERQLQLAENRVRRAHDDFKGDFTGDSTAANDGAGDAGDGRAAED